jgi:dephospho-CoA kinase
MKSKLVAIVGMCGAGKSVVADAFVASDFLYFRFGQVVMDEIKRRGKKITEANEKEIRERLRAEHGMAAFAKLAIPSFEKLLRKGNVIADGLYSWAEYKVLKDKYNDRMMVVAVYSPPETRYRRLEARTQLDAKLRFRPMTREQAKSRDYSEIENIEKGGPIAMADYMIINTGTIKELNAQTESLIKKIKRS